LKHEDFSYTIGCRADFLFDAARHPEAARETEHEMDMDNVPDMGNVRDSSVFASRYCRISCRFTALWMEMK
jgi:hypothetical protein